MRWVKEELKHINIGDKRLDKRATATIRQQHRLEYMYQEKIDHLQVIK